MSLYIIILIISGLGLIIGTILLVPFHITLKLTNKGLDFKGTYQIKWMKINVLNKTIDSKSNKPSKKQNKWNFKKILKVLKLFLNVTPYLPQIIEILIKYIKLDDLKIKLLFGLESPVDTVQLTGVLLSIKSIITCLEKASLIIYPSFSENRFEITINLEFQIKTLFLIKMIQLYTKRPVRKLILELTH